MMESVTVCSLYSEWLLTQTCARAHHASHSALFVQVSGSVACSMVSPAIWPLVEQPASRAISATVLIAAVFVRLAPPNNFFLIFFPLLICVQAGRSCLASRQSVRYSSI